MLSEELLVLTSFRNPYRLGLYITKANFSRCNITPLTLYDPLCVVKFVGLSLNYMPQGYWLTEAIARLLH